MKNKESTIKTLTDQFNFVKDEIDRSLEQDTNEDYPLGGTIERHDIETENDGDMGPLI